MNDQIEIKDLDQGMPVQVDWLVFQKVSDGVVYKAPKSDIEGEDAFVYIAYADDDIGTGFTLTFDANKNYIAIKSTNTEIANPVVGDFAGLWKNYKGIKGDTGDNATADAGTTTTLAAGQPATVTNVGTTSDAVFNFAIPQGEKGACVVSVAFVGNDMVFILDDASTVTLVGAKTDLEGDKGDTGASIVSVAFSGNDIVFTKDDLTTVTLTNGKTILTGPKGDTGVGITSIAKTSTLGLVDTYTINYDDTTTTTFNVTNGAKGDTGDTGNGIASVVKTATVGLVDTYTITFTDLTTFQYDVTNGKDGLGSGDMLKTTYDPASVAGDAFDMDNMAQGTTNKFLSSAELTVVQNTSGINTGDQDATDFDIKDLTDSTNLRTTWTGKEDSSNKSTNVTTDGAFDTKYPSVKAVKTYADTKLAKTTDITAIDDTGIADGQIAIFDKTNKKIKTSDKTIVTTLGNDDTTIPTSKAIQDALPSAVAEATGAELDTGTNKTKYASAKALKDSHNVPSVVPGTSGNVMTSNGTDWTSVAHSGNLVKSRTINVTSAQIKSMGTTLIELIPAPGTGKILSLINMTVILKFGGTAYTGSYSFFPQFSGKSSGYWNDSYSWITSTDINSSSDWAKFFYGGDSASSTTLYENTAIVLGCRVAGNSPLNGNGTMKIIVNYMELDF